MSDTSQLFSYFCKEDFPLSEIQDYIYEQQQKQKEEERNISSSFSHNELNYTIKCFPMKEISSSSNSTIKYWDHRVSEEQWYHQLSRILSIPSQYFQWEKQKIKMYYSCQENETDNSFFSSIPSLTVYANHQKELYIGDIVHCFYFIPNRMKQIKEKTWRQSFYPIQRQGKQWSMFHVQSSPLPSYLASSSLQEQVYYEKDSIQVKWTDTTLQCNVTYCLERYINPTQYTYFVQFTPIHHS